jgi:hypothetical protein
MTRPNSTGALLGATSGASLAQGVSFLAELAVRYLGATGYALYSFDAVTETVFAQYSFGGPLPKTEFLVAARGFRDEAGTQVLAYPLRAEHALIGTLAFVLPQAPISDERLALIDNLARAIEKLYCLPRAAQQTFARIHDRETCLAASRISTRLRSLPEDMPLGESLETVCGLVENVFQSFRLPFVLKQRRAEAER